MDEGDVTNPQSVTVFDIGRVDGDVDVAFPLAWARQHERVEVLLERVDMFGWKAQVLGDDDEHLLGFPWTDHVNRILLGRNERGQHPVDLSAGVWDDLEQGWWARVIPVDRVFIAQGDFDALVDHVRDARNVVPSRPGVVAVNGVEMQWNVVPRRLHDEAWSRAVAQLRAPR